MSKYPTFTVPSVEYKRDQLLNLWYTHSKPKKKATFLRNVTFGNQLEESSEGRFQQLCRSVLFSNVTLPKYFPMKVISEGISKESLSSFLAECLLFQTVLKTLSVLRRNQKETHCGRFETFFF